MLKIKDRLKNNIMPSCMGLFDVSAETIDSEDIIKITLASGTEKPYYIKKLGMSVKVAKYNGPDRVDLVENNEYGYCSLIKATKQVLDKIEVENKTLAKITPKEREERKLWNPVALREAVINAIVHNDYTSEVPPKFEFFDDRIEITSFGSLPQGMTESEFFEGYSVPRNKELMRVFRDLDLVEHLGSGVPRILKSYGKECFKFTENFLQMTFPATEQVTEQVKKLVRVLSNNTWSTSEMIQSLELKHRPTFLYDYLKPALEQGFIEMTIPDKPNSSLQKYRLTILGKQLKGKL